MFNLHKHSYEYGQQSGSIKPNPKNCDFEIYFLSKIIYMESKILKNCGWWTF